jgi:DNA-binding transcriptional LysR family regulator
MSHSVRDLERVLDVTLLSRTTRTVEVIPAGRVFAGLASQVLTELESVIKAVRSMGTTPPQRTLKLGYTISAGLDIVPKLLRTYANGNPAQPSRPRSSTSPIPWPDWR